MVDDSYPIDRKKKRYKKVYKTGGPRRTVKKKV